MSSSRRQYPFHLIEPKWQKTWDEQQAFRAFNPGDEIPANHPFAIRHGADSMSREKVAGCKAPPKFYILDMFPYPSGAGLHVGHPEGYTATDILARYKRAQGFNVLHPMGWDSFGLPAEQYAVKTGRHPRVTTEANIANFTRQIKSLGFSYDWTRELATTDVEYFKWTQWIFLKLYNSWFNPKTNKAETIDIFQDVFSENPKRRHEWETNPTLLRLRKYWEDVPAHEREYMAWDLTSDQRLAYSTAASVWWCEELGTVLANEEVVDGKSEVGGFPVVRRAMRQWMLRITKYSERLLQDLNIIDWSDSLKEMQRNWIGRSEGAEVTFEIEREKQKVKVFTTRPDTLFGATYLVLSPEHSLVGSITTNEQRQVVEDYQKSIASKSDLERTELSKEKTGVFTGAFAINPVNHQRVPVWIADYVLASYGTGAIMAVPAHDERDFEFAKKFNLPIIQVVEAPAGKDWQGFVGDGISVNSDFISGLSTQEAKTQITKWLEEHGVGKKTINYKMRDWLFSRQRYWGEPFPIVWKLGQIIHNGVTTYSYHEALPEKDLPLIPPDLTDYKPTPNGEPPLARAREWIHQISPNFEKGEISIVRETNTMPQWAGSCWYYLRFLDAKNDSAFVGKDAENYWMAAPDARRQTSSPKSTPGVDLYVGGTEHAVLHLLYARFWHKVLFDLGHVSTPEPFFKLVNQGLILGEDGQKMSKSRGNVVNPDDVLGEYGADAFRLYEMFMGPLEMVKPWNTKGVEGVYRFLGRVWRLFVDEQSETEFEQAETLTTKAQSREALLNLIKLDSAVKDVAATPAQLKTLHTCIKKVTEDLDGMRFNTAISAMMVFVNEAITWETKPVSVLREFLILLQPFAPHLAEELWDKLNIQHSTSNTQHPSLPYANWPSFDPALLVESEIEIPIQREGKTKVVKSFLKNADKAEIEKIAINAEEMLPHLEERAIQRVIVQPGRFINLVTKPIGHIAEKIVQEYFTAQGIGIEIQPPNTRHDITIPATGSFVEVKSSVEADLKKIRPIYLSAAQFEEAKQADPSGHPFELHFITGVNPDTGAFQNHYKISSDFILKEAKPAASKNGWVLPVSGAFEQFKL
jgi:leucyl-tRNA synthetase